jgi:hypothetical protein
VAAFRVFMYHPTPATEAIVATLRFGGMEVAEEERPSAHEVILRYSPRDTRTTFAMFASTRIQHVEGGDYRVSGDLTIKDVTREVETTATVEDPWGNERATPSSRAASRARPLGSAARARR